ncbi:MAG TPA: hypothetical protein VM008_13935 [Phycisphaerae bacterium]|nr:hypothetical protein [Phycisphaerae bacterium]
MHLSWLSEQETWVIILVLFAAMMVSAEIACRFGKRLTSRAPEAGKGHFGAIQGSLLGLLALLVSFTFNMSTQRYETRRQLLVEDANTLNALYLRSTLLPMPERVEFKRMLREYVGIRAASTISGRDPTIPEIQAAIQKSATLHLGMWEIARSLAQENPPPRSVDDLLRLLIEAASSTERRLNAFISRVPDPIIWMLCGAATVGMGVIGFSAGLGNHRGLPARMALSVLICGTVYVILDLDRPRQGLMKIDQTPLLQLKRVIDADGEAQRVGSVGTTEPGASLPVHELRQVLGELVESMTADMQSHEVRIALRLPQVAACRNQDRHGDVEPATMLGVKI